MEENENLPQLNKTARNFLRRTQNQVRYCSYCQPYDGGDYVWVFGQETTLDDIFDELEVPRHYREDIANHICCPNCGNCGFEASEVVGKETRYSDELSTLIRRAERKYGQQIDELQKHLEFHPSLALAKPLGMKIYREIAGGNLPLCSVSGDWYRARIISDSRVFEQADMSAPPTDRAREGRYNHAGQSVLYLSSGKEVAICEVLDNQNSPALVWLQKYHIRNADDILDLSGTWENLSPSTSAILVALLSSRLIEQKVENKECKWKPQYFVTRFIADCARLAGLQGIRYSSSRNYGTNIVLFHPDNLHVKPKGQPRVFIHNPQKRTL